MNKKFWVVILFLIALTEARAQFKKAEIKVHGLTCSLCSRSVEMALKKVDFIDKINTDLEKTTTIVTFKKDRQVTPDELAAAVDKAGFSVGYIKMTYEFSEDAETCFEGENEAFTFVGQQNKISSGTYELLMVEKDMMSNSMFKEYKDLISKACNTTKRHYYAALADQLLLN